MEFSSQCDFCLSWWHFTSTCAHISVGRQPYNEFICIWCWLKRPPTDKKSLRRRAGAEHDIIDLQCCTLQSENFMNLCMKPCWKNHISCEICVTMEWSRSQFNCIFFRLRERGGKWRSEKSDFHAQQQIDQHERRANRKMLVRFCRLLMSIENRLTKLITHRG